jgi:hypothetical protein
VTDAEWWQRYQPKDYRLIRSFLGGKVELEKAIKALHDADVRVYTDVVFNHMANEKGQRNDSYNFPGEAELARYRAEREEFEKDRLYGALDVGLFSSWDFNPQGDICNWNDLIESQERWLSGLPDLDLNDWVILQQRTCLTALNDLGFDGYRIDAIKHLPHDHITRVFQIPEMRGEFVFGEALTANDGEENIFLWPLDATSISFYDFPLHETLRRVFSRREACGNWSIRRLTVRRYPGPGGSPSASLTTSRTTTVFGGRCLTRRTSFWPTSTSCAGTAECLWSFPITTRARSGTGRTTTAGTRLGAERTP